MEKITKYFDHDYSNDTTIEFVKSGLYTMLNCSFTSEDPNYGTETIHFSGEHDDSMKEVAYNMLREVSIYLDSEYSHNRDNIDKEIVKNYENYCNSTLIAVERALQEITKGYKPENPVNKHGHQYMIGTIEECADKMFKLWQEDKLERVYVAESFGLNEDDPSDPDWCSEWHEIVRVDLPFDNYKDEMLLMIGYCGGGNVATAYTHNYKDLGEDPFFVENIAKMISESTGLDIKGKIYMEFIKIGDKHSYEHKEEN